MRRAFTIIELLLAIAIGAIVVSTATVAVRVAWQTSAACQALSNQNAMIRAGMLAALDEVDWWRCYDDADAGRTRLRGVDAASDPPRGLAFTPMRDVLPKSGFAGGEDDRGWDADYHWPAADPRTWWRGDALENGHSDQRFGRYAIFSATEPSLTLPAIDVPDTFPGASAKSKTAWSVSLPEYGTVAVEHAWLPNQIAGLRRLGWYAMMEYLPLNATYAYYEPYVAWRSGLNTEQFTNLGGIPMTWVGFGYGGFNDDWTRGMPALLGTLEESTIAPMPYNAGTRGWSTATLIANRDRKYTTGYLLNTQVIDAYGQSLIKQTITETFADDPLLKIKPAHWPSVDVIIHRGLFRRRFNAYCRVSWTDPASGMAAQLDFSAFGTSLRGARQQRGLDAYP